MVFVHNTAIADVQLELGRLEFCIWLSNSGSNDFPNHGHIVAVSINSSYSSREVDFA